MNASEGFSSLVQRYFTQHLCQHKQVSPRPLAAYRDTFRLLFAFLKTQTGKVPSSLGLANLDAPVILAFLDHVESERGNESRSRNARLSAIRSFFEFVSVREPERL